MMRLTGRVITLTFASLLLIAIPKQVLSHSAGSGDMSQHRKVEVPKGQPVPTVSLVIHPDASQGWNLEVKVTNFKFTPEQVNQPGSYNEGHAHLYINGKKETRLYGSWFYLEPLPSGVYYIGVALTTNQHDLVAHNGQIISAQETLVVP